jgi:hypothetical protein
VTRCIAACRSSRRRALTAEFAGFSLHAAVRIPEGCRKQLERLCRHAARPPAREHGEYEADVEPTGPPSFVKA